MAKPDPRPRIEIVLRMTQLTHASRTMPELFSKLAHGWRCESNETTSGKDQSDQNGRKRLLLRVFGINAHEI